MADDRVSNDLMVTIERFRDTTSTLATALRDTSSELRLLIAVDANNDVRGWEQALCEDKLHLSLQRLSSHDTFHIASDCNVQLAARGHLRFTAKNVTHSQIKI